MTTHNVLLKMTDEFTGQKVERIIDKTNAMNTGDYCWELGTESQQRNCLENWIKERGNKQHETSLILDSWVFV